MKRAYALIAAVPFMLVISAFSQEVASTAPSSTNMGAQENTSLNSDVALGKPLGWEIPKYPKRALQNKLQDTVTLKLTISKNGTVKKAEAVNGDAELSDAAVRSARKWRYVPYFLGEKPVEVQTMVSINFRINEAGPDITATYKVPQDSPISEIGKPGTGVTAPKLVFAPDPEYSAEAKNAKLEGVCVLALIVGADGYPRDIKVARSLGLGLDEKAIEAVQKWRFLPARKGGVAVAVAINVELQFRTP